MGKLHIRWKDDKRKICFICLFFFYVLIVNATHNNFTIQQGFDPLPRGSFGVNFFNTTHDANVPILTGLRNSLIVSAACAALSVYFSALTAYAIYAYDFKLRKLAFTVILLIMTMPTQVSALGFLNLMDSMKLTNTLWPLILPSIAAPTVFFFMKQYLDASLPMEIVEAARIDGASEAKTFVRIALPMIKPGIGALAIFTFINSWNDYFMQLIMLSSTSNLTISLGIAKLQAENSTDFGLIMAGAALAAVPIIIIFLIFQKYFTKGIAMGAVKG